MQPVTSYHEPNKRKRAPVTVFAENLPRVPALLEAGSPTEQKGKSAW